MDQILGYVETAQEARAALRKERQVLVRRSTELSKHQNHCIKQIKAAMAEGPRTVPEIAETTSIPAHEVLLFVTAMRKFGLVDEGEKDSGYFRYALKPAPEVVEEVKIAA